MAYTADDLISSVRVLASVPSSLSFQSDTLLLATDVVRDIISPDIVALRGGHYVFDLELPFTGTNPELHRLPHRAFAGALENVYLKRANGDIYELEPEQEEERVLYGQNTTGDPSVYVFQGDTLRLYPTPSNTADSLLVKFEHFPSTLVQTSACGVVASTTDTSITLTDTPPASFVSGALVDAVGQRSGFLPLQIDLNIDNVATNTLNFVSGTSVSSLVAAGDYVCLAEETCLPQVPNAFFGALSRFTAAELAAAQNRVDRAQDLFARAQEFHKRALQALRPRTRQKLDMMFDGDDPFLDELYGHHFRWRKQSD